MQMSGSDLSLYVHIPFCTYKCPYCHFYVVLDKEPLKDLLLSALLKEIVLWKEAIYGKKLVSVYFGGGTPSLFGAKRIQKLLDAICQVNPIGADCEITLEANPENVTVEAMRDFLHAGVNRISIGVQSFQDSELKILGRKHQSSVAERAIFATYEAGFQNISIDLMYETPTQTLSSWNKSLEKIPTLPLTHLSLYNLTIEPYTPFAKKESELRKLMPDEETGGQMYGKAIADLQSCGFEQYEISAFCKNSLFSRHNIGYWIGRPFLGLGPSAFSFYETKRFRNVANLTRYAKLVEDGKFAIDFTEEISPGKRKRELLALHLRLMQGVDLNDFGTLEDETVTSIQKLEELELLCHKKERLYLSKKGIFFYDHVASELL